MADADFDEFEAYGASRPASAGQGGQMQKWMNGAGALTSVALIAGLGVWAYNLAVRDVRGVPVIQALEGPARVAPDNPGGELALHQGLAVNEIAADGTAGDPADRLTLAPRPDGLTLDDQPMGELAASADDGALPPPEPLAATGSDFTEAPAGETSAVLAALRPDEPLPDGPVDAVPLDSRAEEGFVAPDAIAADIPGVARSLRPAARPGSGSGVDVAAAVDVDAMAEAAAAAVAAAMAPQALDVAPETLAEGTRLVQIGAYPDEARARLEWDKTTARFGALLDGKRRVIEPATSGGETFYRLRVEGFTDLDDARRFCAALKAENAECVPAVVR
ncbi:MAG: hypothetical protein B7Z02_05770 [Rhodobacterales bacterium 32-67-9]|nr:MAG: hypothetical protein B7Z02_05770 [Rhodobacterales bacterium 32-67-9]